MRRLVNFVCRQCGRSFSSTHRQPQFCSQACNGKFHMRRGKYQCAYCGKKIERYIKLRIKNKTGLVFCNRECKEKAQSYGFNFGSEGEKTFDELNGGKRKSSAFLSYRKRGLAYYGARCTVPGCGYANIKILEVHHRDKDRSNNRIENLDVVCPTHHNEYDKGERKYVV